MENFRIIRVNELLKRAISDYLHQNFTAEAVSITITQVKATADLKAADVYFSVFSAEEKKKSFEFLKKVRKAIRYGVAKMVRLKHMPQLFFVWDAALDKAHRTFQLLNEIDEELRERDEQEMN
jgi:ribosome-binding factor A